MQSLARATNGRGVEQVSREVLSAVPPVVWFIRRHMRRHRKGLSIPQFRALAKVNTHPKASLSDVAEHLGASLSTTSRIVSILVEDELLTRTGSREDRRQMVLGITPRGKGVLDAAYTATQERMQEELTQLSREEREAVASAMRILAGIFGTLEMPAIGNGAASSRRS